MCTLGAVKPQVTEIFLDTFYIWYFSIGRVLVLEVAVLVEEVAVNGVADRIQLPFNIS